MCAGGRRAPPPPYPNLQIYQPGMAHRILPWLMRKYEMTGFLYWGLNIWWSPLKELSAAPIRQWPASRWTLAENQDYDRAGDGILCYPGPNREALTEK